MTTQFDHLTYLSSDGLRPDLFPVTFNPGKPTISRATANLHQTMRDLRSLLDIMTKLKSDGLSEAVINQRFDRHLRGLYARVANEITMLDLNDRSEFVEFEEVFEHTTVAQRTDLIEPLMTLPSLNGYQQPLKRLLDRDAMWSKFLNSQAQLNDQERQHMTFRALKSGDFDDANMAWTIMGSR